MQIAKLYLLLACGTVGLTAGVFGAEDTELQAKEREAMRQKISQLQAQDASATTPSGEVKPSSLVSPAASDAETRKQVAARAKAREEAEKAAKAEAESNRKAEAKRKAEQESQAKAEARLKAEQEAHSSVAKSAPKEPQAKAAAAPTAESKPAEQKKSTSPAVASSSAEAKPKASAASPAPPAFQPIQVPPSNISTDKQQKLAELLHRYEVDEITPEEYQKERAKILAQP